MVVLLLLSSQFLLFWTNNSQSFVQVSLCILSKAWKKISWNWHSYLLLSLNFLLRLIARSEVLMFGVNCTQQWEKVVDGSVFIVQLFYCFYPNFSIFFVLGFIIERLNQLLLQSLFIWRFDTISEYHSLCFWQPCFACQDLAHKALTHKRA